MASVNKNVTKQPENKKTTGCKISKGLINFLIFLLVGIILMVATGLAVYFVFCVDPDTNSKDSTVNITTTVPPTTCPTVRPPSYCPTRPVCIDPPLCPVPTAVTCRPRPTTACLPCPTYAPCNAPNCAITCPTTTTTTTTTPKPIVLTESELYSVQSLDLVRRYPVRSYERLQVLIQMLEAGSEYYARAFTSRSCHKDYKFVCKYCTDRYEWLRCVFNNDVQGYAWPNQKFLVKEPNGFPKEFRSRAFESSRVAQFNKGANQLGDAQYLNRWINHEAMALWYEKVGDKVTKHCTACLANEKHLEHLECIVYQGYDRTL